MFPRSSFLLSALLLLSSCGVHEENPFDGDMMLGDSLYTDVVRTRSQARTWPQGLSDEALRDKRLVEAVCSGHVECFVSPDGETPSIIIIVHHANQTAFNLFRDSDEWKEVTDDEIQSLTKAANRRRLELCPKK